MREKQAVAWARMWLVFTVIGTALNVLGAVRGAMTGVWLLAIWCGVFAVWGARLIRASSKLLQKAKHALINVHEPL